MRLAPDDFAAKNMRYLVENWLSSRGLMHKLAFDGEKDRVLTYRMISFGPGAVEAGLGWDSKSRVTEAHHVSN